MDELARRVRAARGYAGISQTALADRVGVSTATLKRLEGGQRTLRGFERDAFVTAVANATGLPPSWFTANLAAVGGSTPLQPSTDAVLDRFAQQVSEAVLELRTALTTASRGTAIDARSGGASAGLDDTLVRPLEELAQAASSSQRQSAVGQPQHRTRRRAG